MARESIFDRAFRVDYCKGGEASRFFLDLVIHEQEAVLTTRLSHRYSLSHRLRDLGLLRVLAIG
jgi:hypothetical protein